jgi:hypothetical protein
MSFLKAWTAKNVEHIVPEIPPLTLALEVVDYLKECFDGIFILRKATCQSRVPSAIYASSCCRVYRAAHRAQNCPLYRKRCG